MNWFRYHEMLSFNWMGVSKRICLFQWLSWKKSSVERDLCWARNYLFYVFFVAFSASCLLVLIDNWPSALCIRGVLSTFDDSIEHIESWAITQMKGKRRILSEHAWLCTSRWKNIESTYPCLGFRRIRQNKHSIFELVFIREN